MTRSFSCCPCFLREVAPPIPLKTGVMISKAPGICKRPFARSGPAPGGLEGIVEAAIGIEPMMKVLQTSALPLGYAALDLEGGDDGAGNGIRTRDFNLGKVALYH